MNKYIIIIVLFVYVILLAGCGGKNKTFDYSGKSGDVLENIDTGGAVTGDWIIKREMADAEKLNPIVTNDASAEEIDLLLYEALNDFDYEKFVQIPKIASLPEISEDHLTYTYNLRKDVKWSDGKPLTGEDVIFTLKAIKNPFVDDASLRNYYEKIKRVELVNNDPYIVKMTMSEPYWRAVYSNGDFLVCPKHVLDEKGLTDKYTWDELKDMKVAAKNPVIKEFAEFLNSQEVSRQPKYVIGSGPYMLEKWETGQAITIKRNPNYWDKNTVGPFANKIVFKTIQDASASVVAAKNKEIDVMDVTQPIHFYDDLKNAKDFDLERVTPAEPVFSYIGWNEKNPLFADKKVRLALSYMVDRNSIIEKIYYGQAVKIQSSVYYKDSKYLNKNLPEIPFDIEKGRQLLSEAGWKDTDGDGLLDKNIDGKKVDFKFTFLGNNNPVRRQIALIIIDAMKKVGISADVQDLEWTVYLDKTKKHEFDATIAAWALSVIPPDPYQIFHSSQMVGEGSNYVSYNNPESDKLIEQYRIEFDENKRVELMNKWQQIIYDDQVYTFLWTPKARYVYNLRFKNARWYAKRNSPILSEWWVPMGSHKFKESMN